MNRLLRLAPLALAALPFLACAPAQTPAEKAAAVADQVMVALGGKDRWDKLAGLRWTFQASVNDTLRPGRRHSWDKMTGWHRVEGVRKGVPYLIIHKLNSTEGQAWMNGTPIEGDSLQKLLKLANSLWINDSYWFLMPYKMRDPGAMPMYDGDTLIDGRTFDRISMTFQNVGDTPGDHYWVFVNRANHRVERWDMVLQHDEPPPESYTWEGWEEHDGLWFPTAHKRDKTTIFTKDVETVASFPDSEFKAH
jgi:hypothetical protein